jgi:metal-responsive CopG/Arc/MetJ family transcriptional regulator
MERVIVTLPANLLLEIDALARQTRRKRSQLVRDALREMLEGERRRVFEEHVAEGYREMADDIAAIAVEGEDLQARASRATWHWDD